MDTSLFYMIGVDEVGRGPLAGPVVASAVCFKDFRQSESALIKDSKSLSASKRKEAVHYIRKHAVVGTGIATSKEIDDINILQASLLAMSRAVSRVVSQLDSSRMPYVLVDGRHVIPGLTYPQEAIVKGDLHNKSIAAASIIAKETRDLLMSAFDKWYPEYGFSSHMGYPTKHHREMILKLGVTGIHRTTFKGVKEFVST